MTKIARFKNLMLAVPLGVFQEYHDETGRDEFGISIVEDLSKRYGCDSYRTPCMNYKLWDGVTLEFNKGLTTHVHAIVGGRSGYPEEDESLRKIYVGAHEETHALSLLNKVPYLERRIKEGFPLKTGLKKFDEETRASLGGIYALLKRGYSHEQITEGWQWSDVRRRNLKAELNKALDILGLRHIENQICEATTGTPFCYHLQH